MKYSKLIIAISVLSLLSCKKEIPNGPVNSSENNQNLNCTTCPSLFHPFDDLITESSESCDDFTNTINYPSEFVTEPGIVGYTQAGAHPITILEGGFLQINDDAVFTGLYGVNSLVFDFDGTKQRADFIVYGDETTFGDMGFQVNGSPFITYLNEFPYSFEDITVDIDFSIPDIAELTAFQVSITGDIESITHVLFESGLQELCVTKWEPVEPPVIDKNTYIYFDDFYNYNGSILGSYPHTKTPLGYYGELATSIVIKFDEFLAYEPTKIGFVHVYNEEGSKLINVQLPGTPLIATIPDSLSHFLAPHGYTVEHHHKTNQKMWIDSDSAPVSEMVLDSIIIEGNNLNIVTLGANLQESEIRSICTYYEQ